MLCSTIASEIGITAGIGSSYNGNINYVFYVTNMNRNINNAMVFIYCIKQRGVTVTVTNILNERLTDSGSSSTQSSPTPLLEHCLLIMDIILIL